MKLQNKVAIITGAGQGIGEAYASALAAGNQRPGWDLGVVTDGMLLSAVTAVANNEAAVTPPPGVGEA